MYPEDSELNRLLTEREGHLARLHGDTNGSVSVFSDEFTTELRAMIKSQISIHCLQPNLKLQRCIFFN